jgi:hypothetical protein
MSSFVYSLFYKLLYTSNSPEQPSDKDDIIALAKPTAQDNGVSKFLDEMITIGGAGTWPPRAVHGDAWPSPLRPHHQTFMDLSPALCVEESSLDDEVNSKRISDFRSRLSDALNEIDLKAVIALLQFAEKVDNSEIKTECYNGFFACLVYLRHAYRYVTVFVR